MNIGKLYQFKKYFWFLYPSKEIAVAAYGDAAESDAAEGDAAEGDATESDAALFAYYWSKEFNCNVSYISPNSIFCLLEKDGKLIKVLSTNGELGWIYLADFFKDDIKEVNQ